MEVTVFAPGKSASAFGSFIDVMISISHPKSAADLHSFIASCSPPTISNLKHGGRICLKTLISLFEVNSFLFSVAKVKFRFFPNEISE